MTVWELVAVVVTVCVIVTMAILLFLLLQLIGVLRDLRLTTFASRLTTPI